ncbi:MAG: VTT domain-containing protein [Proteobacteria bacterium]|nr:VTT domain-containing protein [Pseudomonadota bacterium]
MTERPIEPNDETSAWWWLKPVMGLTMVGVLIGLALASDPGAILGQCRDWLGGAGGWGWLIFVGLYVAVSVAALPGTIISALAGYVYHPLVGVALASLGSTAGAAAAFVVGRYFARGAVKRLIAGRPRFEKMDRLSRDHGGTLVAVTRLTLLPFNAFNYIFGLTRVGFWKYVFWSWVGMFPSTTFVVITARAAAEGAQGRFPWHYLGLAAGLLVVLVFTVRLARRKLKAIEYEAEVSVDEVTDR